MNKKSFILYFDLCAVFGELTDEQAGQLIKEIVNYASSKTKDNQTEPTRLLGLLGALYTPFKNHIDRDFEAWLSRAEIVRKNGKKGGRPPSKKTKPNQSKAVTVTVTDTVTEKGKVTENIKPDNVSDEIWLAFVKHRKTKKAPITPIALDGLKREATLAGYTLENAMRECIERNWTGFKAEWVSSRPMATSRPSGQAGTRRAGEQFADAKRRALGEQ